MMPKRPMNYIEASHVCNDCGLVCDDACLDGSCGLDQRKHQENHQEEEEKA